MATAPEEQRIESLAFQCLEAADRHAALARVAAEHPQLVERVRRLVDRVAANESLLSPELVQEAAAAVPTPTQPMDLPRSFGRFQLLECLGMGGMGAVYRARDTQLGRDVALKLIRSDQPAAANARFEREAAAASRLDHPNLCKVYETGLHEGTPFLVMQLVTGTTLQQRIHAAVHGTDTVLPGLRRGVAGSLWLPAGADLAPLLTFFATLADALHHAHERGLVHRDVKPGNIMVTADGAPMVLDFGLVRDDETGEHSLTRTGAVLGSPNYMAPEQILPGLAPLDRRADVYSLGVSLFQALTLRMPFDAPSLMALRELIVRQAPPPARALNPAIGHDLQVVLDTALDKLPDWRFRSAAAFAADLRAIVARRPIAARPVAAPVRTWRWVQRNPIAAALLGTLATGLSVSTWLFTEAQTARAAAGVQLARFDRLAVVERLQQAERAANELFPAWPELAPRLRAWLEQEAAPLQDELERVNDTVRELERAAEGYAGVDAAGRFLLRTLRDLQPQLQRFCGTDGTMQAVLQRIANAETIEQRSILAAASAWQQAIAAIERGDGATAHARYRGLRLTPQMGLVPLGMDPVSKLWEFHDITSAAESAPPPTRDPATGRWSVHEGQGVIFVLIPAGEFLMGAQAGDPSAPHYEPDDPISGGAALERDEQPVHRVALDAFLLAKYEVTQAQWARLTHGSQPSRYHAESDFGGHDIARPTARNPVEQVSWNAAAEVARQNGWTLPTEAQWEYACRAGTDTRFSWGDDPSLAATHANAPELAAKAFEGKGFCNVYPWHDGHVVHAPVGSFLPNPFGLHDMHGNVWEPCRDAKLAYTAAVRPGDGLREPPAGEPVPMTRIVRGGCYQLPLHLQRCADRMEIHPAQPSEFSGFRPSRALLP